MGGEVRKPYAISLALVVPIAALVAAIVKAADWGRDEALLLSLPLILLACLPVIRDEIRGGGRDPHTDR
jgi:hypothetical protein